MFLALSAIHTLWLREHNNVVMQLAELNPHWGEETLYLEGKAIIEAFHQKVAYDEYYPAM